MAARGELATRAVSQLAFCVGSGVYSHSGMAKYLITYDLVGTDETSADYERLIEKIKSYPLWGKVQKSVWVVKSEKTASEVFDEVDACLDSNDRLFVVKLQVHAKWKGSICDSAWLKDFLENN
jgi:hypothetical protein